jgi:Saccharopine dehydrogenase NADP binding domain
VVVYGAYGHTGRFVVGELLRRGCNPVLSGRAPDRLAGLAAGHPGVVARAATIESPSALDRAMDGAAAVINCAGPFAFTAAPVIDAALRARIPYLDVMAEPEIAEATFDDYDVCARELGVAIAPALGFYGGLGDLAATAAMRDWDGADEICLAYALSSWRPTLGTRATIDSACVRRKGGRLTFLDGRVGLRRDEAPAGVWTFPDPIGAQPVAFEFPTADCVTISSHLTVGAIRECITVAPLETSPPRTSQAPEPSMTSGGQRRRSCSKPSCAAALRSEASS